MQQYQETFRRVEKKYILSDWQYHAFLAAIRDIVEMDEYGRTSILNLYFDTPNFYLIRKSLEKPIYKEKLRLRCYGTPDAGSKAFMEIKKKYKGVVYKRRIAGSYQAAMQYLCSPYKSQGASFMGANMPQEHLYGNHFQEIQILGEIDHFMKRYQNLAPRMAVCYQREAYRGIKDPALRITFDTDIRWRTEKLDLRCGNEGWELLKSGDHLMEIKFANAMPLALAEIMSRLHIFTTSYSKYGSAFMEYSKVIDWHAHCAPGGGPVNVQDGDIQEISSMEPCVVS